MQEAVHPLHAADVLDEMESRIVHVEDLAGQPDLNDSALGPSTNEQGVHGEIPD